MKRSIENVLTSCKLLHDKTFYVSSFESGEYENNRTSSLVFLGILITPTVLLNAVAVLTIWKTAQLKKKPSYFVILVQASVDLGIGCLAITLFLVHLLTPFTHIDVCEATITHKTITESGIALSIVTLSALTIDRYVGVLHPYSYNTLVTKRKIMIFVLGASLIPLTIITSSIFSQHPVVKCPPCASILCNVSHFKQF